MNRAPASVTTVEAARSFTRQAVLNELEEVARVRLGAASDTTEDVLRVLAEDPSVTVRAAVAMNRAAPVQADRLLAFDADARVRTLLARKMALLLPNVPQAQRTALQGHVLATLGALVEDEAVRVRAAIADVVKEMPHAPRELILRLAHDSALPVSEPVIRLSPLLAPEDLLALLADAAEPALAGVVAQRQGLPVSVTDRIAVIADTQAIAALLANRSAAIREATLDALIDRAKPHAEWHEPLVRRPSLSARGARALSEIVTTQLLTALASRGDLDGDVTRDLQRRLASRIAGPAPARKQHGASDEPSMAEIQAQAAVMLDDGTLDEPALLAAAQRGEASLCMVMLALAAQVPVVVVERAATLRSAKAMLSLIWKAGFSMHVAGPLQVLLCHLAPADALAGREGGGFPLAVEEMRWQIGFLLRSNR